VAAEQGRRVLAQYLGSAAHPQFKAGQLNRMINALSMFTSA
jgi:hypothetical protein